MGDNTSPRRYRSLLDRIKELRSKYQTEDHVTIHMTLQNAGVKDVEELQSLAKEEEAENLNATGMRLQKAMAELEAARARHEELEVRRRDEESQERDWSAARETFLVVRDRIRNEIKTLPGNVKLVRQDIVQRLCASPWGYSENDPAIINLANAVAIAETKIQLLPSALQLVESQLAEADAKLAAIRSKRQ